MALAPVVLVASEGLVVSAVAIPEALGAALAVPAGASVGSAAALSGAPGIFAIVGPAVLLISALLTAGYLFPVAFKAFFPGEEYDGPTDKAEPSPLMTVPMILLCGVALIMGIFGVTILNGLGF